MRQIERLLEEYYERSMPLGIAFAQDESVLFGFGRPCGFALPFLANAEAFAEVDLESWDAVVFASTFKWGKRLIIQFSRETEPRLGPPDSFVRLATAIQDALDHPREAGPTPTSDVPVQPRAPRTLPPTSIARDENE